MQDFYVKLGDTVTFAKTVGETDIYLFAGITGDFSVNHGNEQYMAQSLADIEVVNQNGVRVAVARHILRWVKNADGPGG